jgi:hypothetical protein
LQLLQTAALAPAADAYWKGVEGHRRLLLFRQAIVWMQMLQCLTNIYVEDN